MKVEVTVGIVTNGSQVLIVKRKEGEGNLRWQFPGGKVELNETDEQAVVREVLEETGCTAKTIKLLGERIHPYTNKSMSYWACKYINGGIKISDSDLEEAKWVDTCQLLQYFTTSIYTPVREYLDLY